jgi:hypothetical protein
VPEYGHFRTKHHSTSQAAENAYYWARSSIFMGSALLQNSGVVAVNHDGSKYT